MPGIPEPPPAGIAVRQETRAASASGPTVIPLASAGPTAHPDSPAAMPARAAAAPAPVRCPNCTALVPPGAAACPACGESLSRKQRLIRCRRCGKQASAQLTLCPHCGRELVAAPSRWLTIGAPVLLALALLMLISLQSEGGNPFRWMADRIGAAAGWVGNLSAQLDPQVEVLTVAGSRSAFAAADGSGEGVILAAGSDAGAAAAAAPITETVGAGETAAEVGDAPAAGAAPAAAGGPAAVPAVVAATPMQPPAPAPAVATLAEPTATSVVMPTATPAATATAISTETPTQAPPTAAPTNTPQPTPTAALFEYTVQQGDTALGIADSFGIDLKVLLAANGLTDSAAALIRPGETLRIPLEGATGSATGAVYTIRAGDTLAAISVLVGVPMNVLMRANGLTEASAGRLQPGETLLIPAPTPTVGPTATPTSMPTATPLPAPSATAAPASATPGLAGTLGLRLSAPVLLGPANATTLSCTAAGRLWWQPVAGMSDADLFRVHLGFIGGRDEAGNPRVTWLINQDVPGSVTQVNLDRVLCAQAPAEYGNQWRWYVEVVAPTGTGQDNLAHVPVSLPSDVWGFVWK